MGTHMLVFPEQEHLRRAPSWGGMHEPRHEPAEAGPPGGNTWNPSYCHNQGGGNTWSKRMAASNNDSDSWEVRAFAEDASTSGQWPPRSYACSFCQREFRTAQALGGHMNVHRRERAQANQSAQRRSGGNNDTPTATTAMSQPDWFPISNSQETQQADHYARAAAGGYHHHRHPAPSVGVDFYPVYNAARSSSPSYLQNESAWNDSHASSPSYLPNETSLNASHVSSPSYLRNESSWNAPHSPSSSYLRNESSWRPHPYENSGHDSLDLELRLGQSSRILRDFLED